MDITLVIPTIKRYDRLRKALDTFFDGKLVPHRTILIDNGKKPSPLVYIVPEDERKARNVWVMEPPTNLGVSGSVNLALRLCMGFNSLWLHSNDDVEVDPDMLIRMYAYMVEKGPWDPDKDKRLPFVVPEYGAGSLFTIFLCNPFFMVERVGFFDEAFFPAYFEDNDYARRMVAQKYIYRNLVQGACYTHYYSSTIQAYSDEEKALHNEQFSKNKAHYVEKWGGEPEFEKFIVPFDGKEPEK